MESIFKSFATLAAARSINPPDGFEPCHVIDPFEAYIGPYFRRSSPAGTEFCMLLDERHLNAMGNAHGGLLMTFADAAMGMLAWESVAQHPVVTLGMNLTFQRPAPAGSQLLMTPRITRQTRSMLFIDGELSVDDHIVAGATSIWRVVRSHAAITST